MNRQTALNALADRIEALLAGFGLRCQITGGTQTPTATRFFLQPGPGVSLERIRARQADIARTLGLQACRIFQEGGFIIIEVKGAGKVATALATLHELKGPIPPGTCLLGRDAAGTPLLLRWTSPDVAHGLIAGTTGSGKSVLLQTILASLALLHGVGELHLVLVDSVRRGLGGLEDLPHLRLPVAMDPAAGEKALGWVVEEMDRRQRVSRVAPGQAQPIVIVAVDELAELIGQAPATEALLQRLVQAGRNSQISVIAATQSPRAEVLSGLVRANFPTRLVGRTVSREDAKVAAGVEGSGGEGLPGRGTFVLVAGGQFIRFQAAMLGKGELDQLYKELGGRARPDPLPEPAKVLEWRPPEPRRPSLPPPLMKWYERLEEHTADVDQLLAGQISQAELFRRIDAPSSGSDWSNAKRALGQFVIAHRSNGGNGAT